ncbi:WhiB family transcriptional regulator [Euzebya pacifica]|nr:WhiB family transcriptional regulator [Euzebya pacifica]
MSDLSVIATTSNNWINDAECVTSPAVARELVGFGGPRLSAAATLTCRLCPVRVDCLITAYDEGSEFGYFGGMSPAARRRLRTAEAAVSQLVRDGEVPIEAMDKLNRPGRPVDALA